MAGLKLINLTKEYTKGVAAVDNISLDIEDKEFIIFVGPSGCGKTSTLRMIAGLEDITKGEIIIDGINVSKIQPKDKDIAMVFQNYALYPHMNVYNNMAFSLKMKKMPKEEIDRRVNEAAKTLGIEDLLNRKPKALSGGQRQRVAMGRAIVREPKVFLMDEPLSNLDAKLRVHMRTEIAKLHKRLKTTFIYVTHDQTEAMTLGQRIVVMNDGIIMQTDTPYNLYNYPANIFVAGFIGSPQMNFVKANVQFINNDAFLHFNGFKIALQEEKSQLLLDKGYSGKEITIGVRAENMKVVFDDNSKEAAHNTISGELDFSELHGADVMLYFNAGSCDSCNLTVREKPEINFESGNIYSIYIDNENIHLFDNDTEERICYTKLHSK